MDNNITDWFKDLKSQKPESAEIIDKLVAGISESGFDNNTLNNWIEQELSRIETAYKEELKKSENDQD